MLTDSWKTFRPDDEHQHEVYEGAKSIIPDVDIFGWLRFKKALRNALNPARHPDTFEVFFMVEGRVDWIINRRPVSLKGGEMMIIAPNQMHHADSHILQPCEHYWLRFKCYSDFHLSGFTHKDSRRIIRGLIKLSGRPTVADRLCGDLFLQMLQCHRHDKPFRKLQAQLFFLQMLAQLAERGTSYEPPKDILPDHVQKRLRKSITLLENEDAEHIPTISELAAAAGLKETSFRRYFERHFGVTPGHYAANHRIATAKKLLLNGGSITAVAHKLGFSTSQYFATVFKQWTGQRPSEFVASAKNRSSVSR